MDLRRLRDRLPRARRDDVLVGQLLRRNGDRDEIRIASRRGWEKQNHRASALFFEHIQRLDERAKRDPGSPLTPH